MKIQPGMNMFFPSDRALWPTYATAQDLGLPILTDSGTYGRLAPDGTHFGRPLHFVDVLDNFPRLTLVMAHSDPTRREILRILRGGQQTVGGIARNFRMSRPAISKHLHLLHAAGLVATRKHGTQSLCSLNAKPLRSISDWLRDYETFWSDSLQSLKRHIEEEQ